MDALQRATTDFSNLLSDFYARKPEPAQLVSIIPSRQIYYRPNLKKIKRKSVFAYILTASQSGW